MTGTAYPVERARKWAEELYPMVGKAVREVSVPSPDMDAFCGRLEDIAELCDDLREVIEEWPWETTSAGR